MALEGLDIRWFSMLSISGLEHIKALNLADHSRRFRSGVIWEVGDGCGPQIW